MIDRPSWAPTAQDLIDLHDEVIAPHYGGGSPGIRSKDALLAAADRPLTVLFGNEMFPTPYMKAAALMESIIRRHPFVDGNKRTAFDAALALVEIATGEKVWAEEEDEEEITVAVATKQLNIVELATWLEDHAVQ